MFVEYVRSWQSFAQLSGEGNLNVAFEIDPHPGDIGLGDEEALHSHQAGSHLLVDADDEGKIGLVGV